MLPLITLISALGAMGAYQYGKSKQKKKDAAMIEASKAQSNDDKNNVAQNVYNYNYLNDSLTGNTLYSSQQKTKRTLFGASNNV